MFERKLGIHTLGETVRIGKAWHGLIKLSSTGLLADAVIKTAGGAVIPYPVPHNRIGDSAPTQLGFAVPRVSAYMHPLAVHEPEMANGMNWSQYVIMQLYRLNGLPFTGLSSRNITFFFTPDYDEHLPDFEPIDANAIPIQIDAIQSKFTVSVYRPLEYDKPRHRIGTKTTDVEWVGNYVHSSNDGRSHYLFGPSRGFVFTEPVNDTSFKMVGMSGNLSDPTDPLSSITVTSSDIAGVPDGSHEEDGRDIKIYRRYSTSTENPTVYTDTDYYPTGSNALLVYWDLMQHEKTTGVHAPFIIDSTVLGYLTASRTETYTAIYDGDVTAVEGSADYYIDAATQRLREFELSGNGHASSVIIESNETSHNWRLMREGEPDQYGGTAEGSTVVSVDGVTVFNAPTSGFVRIVNSKFTGVPRARLGGRLLGSYEGIRLIDSADGNDFWVYEIYVYVDNYFSEDLSCFSVLTRSGISYSGAKVDPTTVTQKINIGKCFSKGGTVAADSASAEVSGPTSGDGSQDHFTSGFYRAYNPLNGEISEISRHPLIYQ